MSINVYTKDSEVRITTTFTTTSGTATDPSTVTVYVKDPTGTRTTYVYGSSAVVKDSTGVYHLDIFANIAGTWWYRFEGTGALVAAAESEFIVPLSQIV